MDIKSPLTNDSQVALEEELNCQKIIDAYRKHLDLDVSHYFQELESIKIYKCLTSGYRFFYPFSLVAKSDLYQKLQSNPNYYSLRWEHYQTENLLQPENSVLEIGCGSGLFLEHLSQKKFRKLTGLEFNPQAIESGTAKGLKILNQDIIDYAKEHPNYHDAVCSFQVLEHISEVTPFLNACINTLKVGGHLILGVPNNNPYLFEYDKYHTLNLPPHHMGLWDQESLTNLPQWFPIRLNRLMTEPLYEYDYYFNLKVAYLKEHAPLKGHFAEFLLMQLRPDRVRWKLKQILSRFLPGRNLLAIYTRI
ncbi:MAG: class I SAM-dependent methyltransferase [Leptolyngbyaceae cyanobacterium bins.59]|nr:class I SAM-dependent methyltransferase [Leptolyngbyaceae cyanobacterium bins.59]